MKRGLLSLALLGAFFLGACVMPPVKPPKVAGYLEDRGVVKIDETHAVSYIRGGDHDAQRIIYVHGTPGSAKAFEHYIEVPIADAESISVDRYGFGESQPHEAISSLKEQASALEPFLKKQGGKWPILVGHSLGGPIVARAAAHYPDRVGGIVIVAGSLDPSLEKVTFLQHVGEFSFMPYVLPSDIRNTNRELIPLKSELETLQPLLKKIRCPIVIIHGTKDPLVPFSNVAYMRANFPTDKIRAQFILEGQNHFLPWNSEPVVRAGIEYLLQGKK